MLSFVELARICKANPANLPPILVVSNHMWTTYVMCDTRGRLWMNHKQMDLFSKDLPVKFVKRLNENLEEYKIDLTPDQLLVNNKHVISLDDNTVEAIKRNIH